MAAIFSPTGTYSNLTRLQLEQLRKADFFAGGKGLTVGDSALPPEGIVGPGDVNAEPFLTGPSVLLDDVYSLTPPKQPGEGLLTITQTSDLASETVKWYGPARILGVLSTGIVTVGGATPVLTDTTQNFALSVLAGDLVLFKSGASGINHNKYAVATVTLVAATTLTLGAVNNVFSEPGTPTQLNADGDSYAYVIVRPNALQLFAVPGSGATGFEQTFMAVVPGSPLHNTVAPTINQINAGRLKNLVPPQYALDTTVDRADSVFAAPAPRSTLDKLGYRVVLYPDNGANAPNLTAPITTLNPVIDPGIPATDQRMTLDYKAGIVRFSVAPQVGGQIKAGVNPTTGRLNLYAVFWAVDQSLVQGVARGLWTTRSTADVAFPAAKVYWDATNLAWRIGSTELVNSAYIRAVGAQDDVTGITEFGALETLGTQKRRYLGYRPSNGSGTLRGSWVMVRQDVTIGGDPPPEQQIQDKTLLTVGDTSAPPLAAADFNPTFYTTNPGARATGANLTAALFSAMADGFGTVHMRRGRFYVTSTEAPIYIPPGIVLEGEDLSTIVQARVYTDTTVITSLPVFKFGPNTKWRVFDSTYNAVSNNVTPIKLGMPNAERIEGHDICWNPVRRVWAIAVADATTNTILFNEISPAGVKTFSGAGIDLKNTVTPLYTNSSLNSSNHTTGHYPRMGYNESTDQYTVVWSEEYTSGGGTVGPTVKSQSFYLSFATTPPSITAVGAAIQHQANPATIPFSAHPSVAIDQNPTTGFLYGLVVTYWAYNFVGGAITNSNEWRHVFNNPSFPSNFVNAGTALSGPQVVSSTDAASDGNDGFLYAFSRRFHPLITGTQGVITLTATTGGYSYITDAAVANWGTLGVQPGSKFMYLGVNPTTLPATVASQFLLGNVSYGTDGVVYDTTSAVNQARIKIAQSGYVYNTLTSWQLITSTHGSVSLGGNQLNDVSGVNFLTSGIQNGDTLYETVGGTPHPHRITGVAATQLTIADTFSANAANQTYYVLANQPFHWAVVPQSAIDTYRYVQSGGFTGETSGVSFAVGQSVDASAYVLSETEPDFIRLARGSGDNWLLVYQSFNTTSIFSKPVMGNFDDNTYAGFLDQAAPLALQDYQAPWREHVSTCAVLLNDYGTPVYPSPNQSDAHVSTAPNFIPRTSRDIEVSNRSLGARPPITKRPNYVRGADVTAPFSSAVGAVFNYALQVSPLCFCHRWTTAGSSLIPDVDWSGTDWTVVSPTKKAIHGYTGTYIVTGAGAGATYFGDPMFYFGTGAGNPVDGNYLQATVSVGDRIYFPSSGVFGTIQAVHSEHIVQFTQADSALLNKGVNGHYQNTEWVLQRTSTAVQTSGGGLKNAGFRVSAEGRPILSSSYITFADNPTEDQFGTVPDEVHLMRRANNDSMFSGFNLNAEGSNLPGVLYEDPYDPHSRYTANINFQGAAPGEPKGCNELSGGEAPSVALAWGETLFGLVDHVVAGTSVSRVNYVGFYRQSFGPYYNGMRNLSIVGNTQTPFSGASTWTQLKTLSRQRVSTRHGEPNASSGYFATDGYRNCFGTMLQILVPPNQMFPNPLNNNGFTRIAATYTDAIGRNPIMMQGPRTIFNARHDGTTASSIWSGFPQTPISMTPVGMSHPHILWDGTRFVGVWADGGSHLVTSMACALHLASFPGDEDTGPQGPEMVGPYYDAQGPRILQTQPIEIRPNVPVTGDFFVSHDIAFSGKVYGVVWTAGLDPSQTIPCILGVTLFDGQGLGNRVDSASSIRETTALAMPSQTGATGSGVGTAVFTDLSATFSGTGAVSQGDILIVHNGAAQGRYIVTGVLGPTAVQTDQIIPTGTNYVYSLHRAEYPPGAATYILAVAAWAPVTDQEQVAFVTPKIIWNGYKFIVIFGNHQHGLNVTGYSPTNVLGILTVPENGLTTPLQIKRIASNGAHLNGVANPGIGTISSVGGSTTTLLFSASGTDYQNRAQPLYNVGDILVITGTKNSGTASSISAVAGDQATITGLTGMTASLVGQQMTFTGAATGANNGSFIITAYISATSVQIENAGAVAPDANNGAISWSILWRRDDGWYPITSVNWTANTCVVEYVASGTVGTVYGSVVSMPVGDPLQRPTGLNTGALTLNALNPRPMLLTPGENSITTNPGFSYDRLYSFIYNDVDDEYALLFLNNTVGRLVFQRWKSRFDLAATEVSIAAVSGLTSADMAFNGREFCIVYGDSTGNNEVLRYALLSANGVVVSTGIVDNGRNAGGVIGNNLPNQIPGQLYGAYIPGINMIANIRNVQIRWNNRLNRWIISASYHWYSDESFSSTAELPPYYQLPNTHVTSITGNQITLNVNTDIGYIQPGCKLVANTFASTQIPIAVYGVVSVTPGVNPVITLDTANIAGLTAGGTFGNGSLVAIPREDVICYSLGYTTPAVQFLDADECFLDNVTIGGAVDIEEKYRLMAMPTWQAAGPVVAEPSLFDSNFNNIFAGDFALATVPNVHRRAQYNHLLLRPTRVRGPVYTNVRSSTKARYGYGLTPHPRGTVMYRRG